MMVCGNSKGANARIAHSWKHVLVSNFESRALEPIKRSFSVIDPNSQKDPRKKAALDEPLAASPDRVENTAPSSSSTTLLSLSSDELAVIIENLDQESLNRFSLANCRLYSETKFAKIEKQIRLYEQSFHDSVQNPKIGLKLAMNKSILDHFIYNRKSYTPRLAKLFLKLSLQNFRLLVEHRPGTINAYFHDPKVLRFDAGWVIRKQIEARKHKIPHKISPERIFLSNLLLLARQTAQADDSVKFRSVKQSSKDQSLVDSLQETTKLFTDDPEARKGAFLLLACSYPSVALDGLDRLREGSSIEEFAKQGKDPQSKTQGEQLGYGVARIFEKSDDVDDSRTLDYFTNFPAAQADSAKPLLLRHYASNKKLNKYQLRTLLTNANSAAEKGAIHAGFASRSPRLLENLNQYLREHFNPENLGAADSRRQVAAHAFSHLFALAHGNTKATEHVADHVTSVHRRSRVLISNESRVLYLADLLAQSIVDSDLSEELEHLPNHPVESRLIVMNRFLHMIDENGDISKLDLEQKMNIIKHLETTVKPSGKSHYNTLRISAHTILLKNETSPDVRLGIMNYLTQIVSATIKDEYATYKLCPVLAQRISEPPEIEAFLALLKKINLPQIRDRQVRDILRSRNIRESIN
jgi:hypothetical protein